MSITSNLRAEDGYRLWLRYDKIKNIQLRNKYVDCVQQIYISGDSKTIEATKNELQLGFEGLLNKKIPFNNHSVQKPALIVGTPQTSAIIRQLKLQDKLEEIGNEGYLIIKRKVKGQSCIIIAANKNIGLLYGSFHLLRMMQMHESLQNIDIKSAPQMKLRILDHWDNLKGSGNSIWNGETLPDYINPKYKNYARANASIGINGVVLNNVNAHARVLTHGYLEKVAALAEIMRPYGIKVYLSAKFSAPIKLVGLSMADPQSPEVQKWWNKKADEIYEMIPNFGGFLVKANSEGQPGPQDYGRSHAQGANMLAHALEPHGGIVMWRAFVHSPKGDRAKQQFREFKPLDGKFAENVVIQVKNGPIDFQPREPFNPLFGSMPRTPLMIEFQIKHEYLGRATSLVYLAPLFKDALESNTYRDDKHPTVGEVVDGSFNNHQLTGMAGVANIGKYRNWTGHPFGQANWYAFGRLAWNHSLESGKIADEWIRMTFSNNESFIKPVKRMMLRSWQISVDYRTPLGLYLLTGITRHFGPAPWQRQYIHHADSLGIGIDRTTSGSDAVNQYAPTLKKRFNNIDTTPEKYLLWFHHVSWDYKLTSGRSLWQELVHHYYSGVDSVRWMENTWEPLKKYIDRERFNHVKSLLKIQEKEAQYWRDACVLYFQQFANRPIPDQYEKPQHELPYYKNLVHEYMPLPGGLGR